MNLKTVVAAMLVTAGALGAGAAQARPDVDLVVRIGVPLPLPPLPPLPGIVIRPAPVVVQAPVYSQPVYSQPVYQPAPVYADRDWHDRRDDRRDYRGEYRDHRHHDRDGDWCDEREAHRHPTRWEVDGDGVPNHHDRRPYDPRRF